ncbi:hypothetical protein [Lichenicola sp.]|uniref:hypothetical protein n=1 Tax=Lichenicola sp. TaxID=2804529 RepID=UPI003B00D572
MLAKAHGLGFAPQNCLTRLYVELTEYRNTLVDRTRMVARPLHQNVLLHIAAVVQRQASRPMNLGVGLSPQFPNLSSPVCQMAHGKSSHTTNVALLRAIRYNNVNVR